MTDKEEYMEKLNQIIRQLDSISLRLYALEATRGYGKPDPDPNYWQYPRTPTLDRVTKCIKCGMEFRGATGYVCNTYGCPTFMQVTCGDVTVTSGSTSSTTFESAYGGEIDELGRQ